MDGKQNPGLSLVRGCEMAQSGAGQEADRRGCDPLSAFWLFGVQVAVVRPLPSLSKKGKIWAFPLLTLSH